MKISREAAENIATIVANEQLKPEIDQAKAEWDALREEVTQVYESKAYIKANEKLPLAMRYPLMKRDELEIRHPKWNVYIKPTRMVFAFPQEIVPDDLRERLYVCRDKMQRISDARNGLIYELSRSILLTKSIAKLKAAWPEAVGAIDAVLEQIEAMSPERPLSQIVDRHRKKALPPPKEQPVPDAEVVG